MYLLKTEIQTITTLSCYIQLVVLQVENTTSNSTKDQRLLWTHGTHVATLHQKKMPSHREIHMLEIRECEPKAQCHHKSLIQNIGCLLVFKILTNIIFNFTLYRTSKILTQAEEKPPAIKLIEQKPEKHQSIKLKISITKSLA